MYTVLSGRQWRIQSKIGSININMFYKDHKKYLKRMTAHYYTCIIMHLLLTHLY